MKAIVIISVFFFSTVIFAQENFNVDSFLNSEGIELLMPTFRGTAERNFYGWGELNKVDLIWKFNLGEGITVMGRKGGKRKWKGAGWTGQPLLVKEGNDTFLIQGSYDHYLRKISASDGKEIWRYKFDDVIKGTGTLWINRNAKSRDNSILILQGSRLGTHHFLDAKFVPSFRAISYFSGKELWRMDSRLTHSYSRDVDASCLIISDTAYIGLENGTLRIFNPDPDKASSLNEMHQPECYGRHLLYEESDLKTHQGNLVTESSPALLGNHVYLASGSGHVYGYNRLKDTIDWNFYIGSDLDGSIVVTSDSCLLVSVEKQFIKGKGGVFKLDPSRLPSESVEWYFPVEDTSYADWEGGVIGTVAVNDYYTESSNENLAVVSALDGNNYILKHKVINKKKKVYGPLNQNKYPTPELVSQIRTSPSISSPLITDNRIILSCYNGVYLYSYDNNKIEFLDRYGIVVEASPVLYGKRIFIASRNGFLYCLGEKH